MATFEIIGDPTIHPRFTHSVQADHYTFTSSGWVHFVKDSSDVVYSIRAELVLSIEKK